MSNILVRLGVCSRKLSFTCDMFDKCWIDALHSDCLRCLGKHTCDKEDLESVLMGQWRHTT